MSSQLGNLIYLLDFSIQIQDPRKSYWVRGTPTQHRESTPCLSGPSGTEASALELIGRSKPDSIEHGRDLEAMEYLDHGQISTHSDLFLKTFTK